MEDNSGDLIHRIERLLRRNKSEQSYLPLQSLFRLLSREAIEVELSKSGIKAIYRDELTEQIISGARRVFAILVLIGEVRSTESLLKGGLLDDTKLPFTILDLSRLEMGLALNFNRKQWDVQAPCFSYGTIPRSIRSEVPMPFIKDDCIAEGGFGVVHEISLDSEHQQLEKDDTLSQRLVRKELEINHTNHEVELENLSTLKHLRHSNIIELLFAFEYKGKYNLIFPLAEGETLFHLFEKESHDTPFDSDEKMLVAMAHLSSAIEHVHDFVYTKLELHLIGYHHDLRPKNILVSGNSLLLADFGLSRFKNASENSKTTFKRGIDDYLAPECEDLDNNFKKSFVGRSSDIWSFGCILAQFATYLIRGPQGIKQFRTERRFEIEIGQGSWTLYYFHCGSRENLGVERWLLELESAATDSRSRSMLIALVREILKLQESDRPKAWQVTVQLERIALYEMTSAIEELFNSVYESDKNPEANVQLWRYNGWRYGLGVLDKDYSLLPHGDSRPGGIINFKATLECLSDMRDCLMSILAPTSTFQKIALLNDSLMSLLNKGQQERARDKFYSAVMKSDYSEALEELRTKVETFTLDRELRLLAALKSNTRLADELAGRGEDVQQLDVNSITELKPFGGHYLGLLTQPNGPRRILVEWRKYTRQGVNENVNEELFMRMQSLAKLLGGPMPKGFCSLSCRGFYHDPSRLSFGMVYDLPRRTSMDTHKTLRDLIKDTKHNPESRPTLEDKFKIAYILAKALREFHLVGWMHKNLVSTNIAFFPDATTPPSEQIREPFIIGFTHSRQNEPSAFTLGASDSSSSHHQHPQYRKDNSRYRPEFDYYSLGILLLELGFWAPIQDIVKTNGSASDVQRRLLASRVPVLGSYMGTIYREAVRVCIAGDFGLGEKSPNDDGEMISALTESFETFVVDRLRKLYLALS